MQAEAGKAGAPQGQSAEEEAARERRASLDELLSSTFNTILRVEERALQNKVTRGLTIAEMHTIAAVGLYESNPMNVVAARLDVTLATLTSAVAKLERKGFVRRSRSQEDRRKVLVSLTKSGRAAYRSHRLFHRSMVESALEGLTEEEERVFARALGKVKRFFEDEYRRQEGA